MADDWQPGDLALCLGHPRPRDTVRAGAIYIVIEVFDGTYENGEEGVALALAEVSTPFPYTGFNAAYFRKIKPHTPDAEDRETIRLLNGAPVKETV